MKKLISVILITGLAFAFGLGITPNDRPPIGSPSKELADRPPIGAPAKDDFYTPQDRPPIG